MEPASKMATVSKIGKMVRFLGTFPLILSMVLLQKSAVHCQTYGNGADLPTSMLPFCATFPGTLRSGQVIKIMGSVEQTRSGIPAPWFNVVLRRKCHLSDSPFYLKIRFDNEKLIRNSFQDGNWGDEESEGQFPFSMGAQFLLLIEVQQNGYKVTGNGVQLWTFPNRLTATEVSFVDVSGSSTSIRRVELIDTANKDQPGKSEIIYPWPMRSKSNFQPSFPFWGYFPEGLQVGKVIRITGIYTSIPQRTAINLCADCFKGPIMLHLDLRFKFGRETNTAVRNIYVNGAWGNYEYEERGGPFPFHLREPFVMLIKVQPDCYNISVNDQYCWTFKHKLPFTQVTSITIERGPIVLWHISYIDEDKIDSEAETTRGAILAPAAVTSSSDVQMYHTTLLFFFTWFLQLM